MACPKERVIIDTDVYFNGLRDNSEHASAVTYFLLDNKTEETFQFKGGGNTVDHIELEYSGQQKTIDCISKYKDRDKGQCKMLPVGIPDEKRPVDAVLLSVDMKPRNGTTFGKGRWHRNKYTLLGSHFNIACQRKHFL